MYSRRFLNGTTIGTSHTARRFPGRMDKGEPKKKLARASQTQSSSFLKIGAPTLSGDFRKMPKPIPSRSDETSGVVEAPAPP